MDKYSDLLVEATIDVVNKLAASPVGSLPEDPVDLVLGGYVAPMRVFVKNEPHAPDKLKDGRVRLIVMVPFHVVLAEMLIFGIQNNEEISHWDEVPSKCGIGLADDAHIETMCMEMERRGLNQGNVAEADISGFDWSLTDKMFYLDAKRRWLLSGQQSEIFRRLLFNMHHVMCRSVFALSDGRMYKQNMPGLMKSGRYVTSSTNSFIRVLLAHSIGAKWCVAMGDDSLEEYVDGAQEKYERLGVKVKFYTRSNRNFEFCSHTFVGGIAYPSKPGKMLYNLFMQKRPTMESFQQWAFEMRHHPEYDNWVMAIVRSGWAVQIDGKQKVSAQDEEGI
jgi:hypothetical protein